MSSIPAQLRTQPLIRVCRPDCRSHDNCSHAGKRPVSSTNNIRETWEIKNWIKDGGNYGVVPKSDNDLIVFDSDSRLFSELVQDQLPETFTVKTGSGNYHFYFRSQYNINKSFKQSGSEFGSIRSANWHTVGAGSVHPDTGNEYRVAIDTELNILSESDVSEFINSLQNRLDSHSSREDGSGGGGSAGLHVNNKTASDLDTEPKQETLRTLGFINSESRRTQIAKVFDTDHPPRQIRVWACSFLHSAVGLTQNQIETLLYESAVWAYDKSRIEIEIRSLIQSSINNNRADESVNLAVYIDDMNSAVTEFESHKTESLESQDLQMIEGGENIMSNTNWNTELIVKNGNAVVQAGEEHINPDGNNTGSWDTISLLFGELSEDENFGEYPEWDMNQYGSPATCDLGNKSPDELRLAAQALEDLADELEG
jgi:hypothetical protein